MIVRIVSLDESMNRNLNEFATEPEYVNCTYTKGMLLFESLRQTLGEKKLIKCLKEYYKDYACHIHQNRF